VTAPAFQPAPPSGVLRALLHLPVHLYHARLGVLLGHRFLLLVHTGRKTGAARETVLEVLHYDPVERRWRLVSRSTFCHPTILPAYVYRQGCFSN